MLLELVLATALVGQCNIPIECPSIVSPTVHHIRNLSAPERSRHYIQIRLADIHYSMSIPVINGVVPTVTPCVGYTEFIFDYCCKPPAAFDPTKYSGITVFEKAQPHQTKPKPQALVPIPRRAPKSLPPPQSLEPLLIPVEDIRSQMKRPSQIK